ncbi:MAG: MFS transporter [Nitrososphaera sp.]|jgi:MFS family permease
MPKGNLAVLTAAAALSSLSSIALAFLPVYFTALGGSVAQYGFVTALGMAAGIPSTLFGGVIIPRFGLRRIVVAASWIAPAFLLGYYLSADWKVLSVVVVLAGTGSLGSIASRQLIADATSAKSRTGQLSLYQTLSTVPAMCSPAAGGYLITTLGTIEGFRLAALVAVLTSVASTILIVRFLRETKPRGLVAASRASDSVQAAGPAAGKISEQSSTQHFIPSIVSHLRAFLANGASLPRVLAPLLAAYALVTFANSATGPYFIFYATSNAKMDTFHWGLVLSIQAVLANLIRTPLGMAADRFDKRKVILLSILMTAPLASAFVFVSSFWAILGLSLAMVATGIYYGPTHEALQIELTPREKRPSLFAVYDILSNVCRFGGLIAGGILFSVRYALPFYAFTLLEFAAAVVVAATLFGRLGTKLGAAQLKTNST